MFVFYKYLCAAAVGLLFMPHDSVVRITNSSIGTRAELQPATCRAQEVELSARRTCPSTTCANCAHRPTITAGSIGHRAEL